MHDLTCDVINQCGSSFAMGNQMVNKSAKEKE